MDKFLKICLGVASVSIVLGIVIIAGLAVSGKGREVIEVMEDGGVYFDEDGFTVGSTIVLGDNAISDFSVEGGKEYKYNVTGIKNLNLELEAGIFQVVEGDGEEIVIRSNRRLNIDKDDDSISIETPNHFKIIGFGNEMQNVEIALPKGVEFHTIDIDVGAGDFTAESLLAQKMDIDIGAGEIVIENGSSAIMDLDVGMGSFAYTGSLADELDVDCGMGNVEMVLSGQYEDHDYEVDCGMGSVCIGSMTYSGAASGQKVDNGTDSDFDIDCGMGNISIIFEN